MTDRRNVPFVSRFAAVSLFFVTFACTAAGGSTVGEGRAVSPQSGRSFNAAQFRRALDFTYGYGGGTGTFRTPQDRLSQMKEGAMLWRAIDDRGGRADCAVFYYGLGMAPDYARAFRCYSHAGDQGVHGENARTILAIQYWNGQGVAEDRKKAEEIEPGV